MFRPLFLICAIAVSSVSGFLCAATLSALGEESRIRLNWSLYGGGVEALETQSRIAGSEIEASLSHDLTSEILVRAAIGFQFETGMSRARFNDEFRPRQVQRLREAVAHWTPYSGLAFTLGAVDQDWLENSLLLQRQSFPALKEEWTWAFAPNWKLELSAQQSFASDTSTNHPWGNWSQGLPAFYVERIGLSYARSYKFFSELHVSHFLFENLSGPLAFQAQFMGNTVTGIGSPDGKFVYGFQGFEGGWEMGGQVAQPLVLRGGVTGLLNTSAPSGRRQALRVYSGLVWDVDSAFRLMPLVELFRAESDAAPGFFNDRVFGHGNRQGAGISLTADWHQKGIQASAQWISSRVIDAHPYQSDLRWFQLTLRARYDVL